MTSLSKGKKVTKDVLYKIFEYLKYIFFCSLKQILVFQKLLYITVLVIFSLFNDLISIIGFVIEVTNFIKILNIFCAFKKIRNVLKLCINLLITIFSLGMTSLGFFPCHSGLYHELH